VARVLAFIPDLLFGSSVHAALAAAGHEVELVASPGPEPRADVLVVDLTADAAERIEQARPIVARGVPTLAFYAHVETDVRALAEQAGYAVVVPRSRMAREAVALVEKLGANIV
jgi:hypothetical protein